MATSATSEQQLSEILSQFARTMLTDFPIQRILEELVGRIVELLDITGAGVTLISDTTSPHFVAASDQAALNFEELQTFLDEGPCVVAYQTGVAVSSADLRNEKRFPRFARAALDAGLGAVFTFPLRQGDKRLGALDLYRDLPGPLTEEAMTVSQTLADVVSAYLVNAQGRADLVDSSSRAQAVALHDGLTGFPNRTLLLELLEHALLSRRRTGKHLAVLFFDLDGFKQINDGYGHRVGDDLLIAVGSRIAHLLRPGDTFARLAGDEFVIVCEGLEEEAQIGPVADRIIGAMSIPFDLAGVRVDISASIGVAFAGNGDKPEELLHRADLAMYQVKRKGGAGHQVIDVDEQQHAEYIVSLKKDLGYAVELGQLLLEYQPVVSASDGRVHSVEALVRWEHPQRGLIQPAILIPLAESSGDILNIGQWVLEKACLDRHRWEKQSRDDNLVISVNVSVHQLMSPGFAEMVEGIIFSTNTQPQHLCLEITESAFVRDAQRAHTVLSQLKDIGVQVALDDFGTGYSSLSYLMEFPVDIVKIDKSFIDTLMKSDASHAIVAKTIELAHLLMLTVICEGVETLEQDREVTALSTDFSQGFYFSRPVAAEAVKELMSATTSAWTIKVPEAV